MVLMRGYVGRDRAGLQMFMITIQNFSYAIVYSCLHSILVVQGFSTNFFFVSPVYLTFKLLYRKCVEAGSALSVPNDILDSEKLDAAPLSLRFE